MKKKLYAALFVAAFTGIVMTGCKQNVGTPEDNAVIEDVEEEAEPGYLFGYSCIDMGNPYFETLKLAMENELDEKEGRIITKDAQTDAELQAQQIEELIEEGVDAVFLSPVDWEAITPSLEALDEAGIPVINIDTQVKATDLIDAFVGSDNYNAGIVCGEDLIENYPDGGKVLILECTDRNSIIERINGFERKIANAGFEVLARADGRGEKETAKELMKEFLEKYPQIDAVMCGNDTMALGAMETVKEAKREGIVIYGVDGSPEVKAEIAKEDSPIVGTGAQSPINMGKYAVKTALNILTGEEYKESREEDTFLINKENISLYGIDGWQ
ncbi:MAG: sugar ABC transporter substrate-binding protein [Schaedlerella sp.]|nr:sugar ABC transporter substrate-binding protein [Schaedlerella sp.]